MYAFSMICFCVCGNMSYMYFMYIQYYRIFLFSFYFESSVWVFGGPADVDDVASATTLLFLLFAGAPPVLPEELSSTRLPRRGEREKQKLKSMIQSMAILILQQCLLGVPCGL